MPTDHELMQQALDDIESLKAYIQGIDKGIELQIPSLEALRARLAEPEQESTGEWVSDKEYWQHPTQPEQDGKCSYCDGAGCVACDARFLSAEPVAWFMERTFMDGTPSFIQVCETDPEFYTPLYRTPPQREWQGLSTAETKVLWNLTKKPREYAEMIEAKLKERNT